jgi:hypothetical protein
VCGEFGYSLRHRGYSGEGGKNGNKLHNNDGKCKRKYVHGNKRDFARTKHGMLSM